MSPEDIRQLLQTRPFQPFRLHLTDGTHDDVLHPDQVFLTRRTLIVGVSFAGDRIPDRAATVALIHVVRVEPLEVPAA